MSENVKTALIRLARILIGQVVGFAITNLVGVNIPVINISVGATINALAKYLREKLGWNWLPV